MNRLGACASEDTHKRYIQYRVEKSMKQGPMCGYPSKPFTVASADNLDFIHSHARVYAGKQQLSWHGTTVQLVQPQPCKLVDTSKETQPTVEREVLTHGETTQYSDTQESATRNPLLQWEHWKLGFKVVYPNGLTQHVLLSVVLEKAYHFASDSGE